MSSNDRNNGDPLPPARGPFDEYLALRVVGMLGLEILTRVYTVVRTWHWMSHVPGSVPSETIQPRCMTTCGGR